MRSAKEWAEKLLDTGDGELGPVIEAIQRDALESAAKEVAEMANSELDAVANARAPESIERYEYGEECFRHAALAIRALLPTDAAPAAGKEKA